MQIIQYSNNKKNDRGGREGGGVGVWHYIGGEMKNRKRIGSSSAWSGIARGSFMGQVWNNHVRSSNAEKSFKHNTKKMTTGLRLGSSRGHI